MRRCKCSRYDAHRKRASLLRAIVLALIVSASLAPATLAAAGADAVGTITIVEGEAQIYRGNGRARPPEGLRLAFGDIVETGAAAFAQIELADHSVLQLGPATRVMLDGSRANRQRERWLYVIDGWVKLSSARRDPDDAGGFEMRAPLLDIAPNFAVVVLRVAPGEAAVLVERGRIDISERRIAGPRAVALEAGDCYRREAGAPGRIDAGAKPLFVAGVPRWFRDTLPRRIDRFRDHDVELAQASDFSYADVQMWLKAEAPLRRQFAQRWSAKSRDAAFRAALLANLAAHTEWAPILFAQDKRVTERASEFANKRSTARPHERTNNHRPNTSPPWLPPPLLGPASPSSGNVLSAPPTPGSLAKTP